MTFGTLPRNSIYSLKALFLHASKRPGEILLSLTDNVLNVTCTKISGGTKTLVRISSIIDEF